MAPSRATQAGPSKERPSNKKLRSRPYPKNPRRSNGEDALPGVQKLKSAIRQTKRLLAKDNLAADVRVGTERRLKALEGDLARAEQSRKARLNATKYHKVRFFERQKLVRKINKTKRSIATSEGKEKELELTLADLRVDLNYVLLFPKTEKYVSLFPSEVRKSGSARASVDPLSDDNKERSKWREVMRRKMQRGELSADPENDLGKLGQEDKRPTSGRRGMNAVPGTKSGAHTGSVAGDDFFGDDDDSETSSSD